MITTKFIFANLGTPYRLNKKLQNKQISMPLKRQNATLKCFLDQDDCRVNFVVSVNLAKNLLVKF